jgi:hypothetical protein
MKVLIGIDGSPGSFAALRFAGSHKEKDEIYLYYSPPPLGNVAPDVVQFICTSVFEHARRQLPAPFQEAAKTIVGVQKPEHGLLIAADECRADMLEELIQLGLPDRERSGLYPHTRGQISN